MNKWQNFQKQTYRNKPNKLIIQVLKEKKAATAVDLGCGSGNDTVYMVRKGLSVTAIDSELNESFILERLKTREKAKVTLIKETFENVTLPKCDILAAFFSLPFCKIAEFPKLWNKIYESLNDDGYFIGQLFGDRDDWKERQDVITLTKEEVLKLLEKYEIVRFDEVEYIRETDNKKWHFFDIIARKIKP